jgi:hypothetical protein
MKKTLLYLGIAIFAFSLQTSAQPSAQLTSTSKILAVASIKWESKTKEIGTIEFNKPVDIYFEFTNEGTVPLTIKNAKASCGCTVASYPKEPILPGQTEKIKVRYNASAEGNFNKSVTITSNANNPTQVLYFSGKVE